jgi:fucose permease
VSGDTRNLRRISPWLYSGFFLSGLTSPIVAALSPELAQRHHLSTARVGLYFTVLFFASFVSAAIANRNAVLSLRTGFASMAAGVLLLLSPVYGLSVLGAVLIGVAIGFINPATNGICAYGGGSGSDLISLNLVWSLGFVFSTMLFHHFGTVAKVGPSVIAFVAALHCMYWLLRAPVAAIKSERAVAHWKFEILFALALFLYVGAENGIASWTKLLVARPGDEFWPGFALIGFSVAMLVGRIAAPWWLKKHPGRETAMLYLSLTTGACCALMISLSRVQKVNVVLVTLAGLFIAPLFPLIVFRFSQVVAQQRSWAYCTSGLGASLVPALMGVMAEATGIAWTYTLPCLALVSVAVMMRSVSAERMPPPMSLDPGF